ncbi:peptidase inhibitor family I36 protein [Actinosynnema sp. CS-041913]|uniref:peptidase inhibitor family I36 protein n=1 Tax=Actinosynnema sp. CS-041913 TaxID=3239917 RepID=UPI003D8AF015
MSNAATLAGLGAAVVLTAATVAGATSTPATAAAPIPAWECDPGTFCLYDSANGVGRFYQRVEGCWFINIGLEGFGDRADSARNRTSHRVNIANWTGSAWQHLGTVHPGTTLNLGANSDKADAIHAIC